MMNGYIKKQLPIYYMFLPLIVLFFAALLYFADSIAALGFTAGWGFLYTTVMITGDYADRWCYLTFTLPRGRERTVRCYYMMSLLPTAVHILLSVLFGGRMGKHSGSVCVWMALLLFASYLFITSFLHPLTILLWQKRRLCVLCALLLQLVYGVGMAAALRFFVSADKALPADEPSLTPTLILGFGIAAAVACVMYIASFLFAASIMKKKELV